MESRLLRRRTKSETLNQLTLNSALICSIWELSANNYRGVERKGKMLSIFKAQIESSIIAQRWRKWWINPSESRGKLNFRLSRFHLPKLKKKAFSRVECRVMSHLIESHNKFKFSILYGWKKKLSIDYFPRHLPFHPLNMLQCEHF